MDLSGLVDSPGALLAEALKPLLLLRSLRFHTMPPARYPEVVFVGWPVSETLLKDING